MAQSAVGAQLKPISTAGFVYQVMSFGATRVMTVKPKKAEDSKSKNTLEPLIGLVLFMI